MPTPPLPPDVVQHTLETWVKHDFNAAHAGRELKLPRSTVEQRIREALQKEGTTPAAFRKSKTVNILRPRSFEVEPIESGDESVEDLIERKKSLMKRRQKHEAATKLRTIKINIDGPFGILHFGDPHLDDDHCDIGAVEAHCKLVRKTEGMLAGNVGDVTNNWVGRLAHLHSQQTSTSRDAWRLAQWMTDLLGDRLLYLVGGNHDAWAGDSDPLRWIMAQTDAIYQSSEVRMALKHPAGVVRVNCRHDFAGHSMYNGAHGVAKALQFGLRDHLAVCGHKHISAYNVLKDGDTGIVMHALRVASYKLIDHYAKTHGFRDQHLSPCAVTVFNTMLPDTHPDMVKVYWDADEGAEALLDKRARWKRRKS